MSKDINITCIKGFLIILVVIGHYFQLLTSAGVVMQGAVLTIYSFHMPAFVFISGFLSKNIEKRRSRAFEDLLIPFVIFQIVFVVLSLICKSGQNAITNIFYPEFALRYLLALFIWRMILPDIIRLKGILIIAVIANILTGYFTGMTNAFAAQRMVGFLIYFLLGYYSTEQTISKLCRIKRIPALLIMLCEVAIWIILVNNKVIDYNNWVIILTHQAYFDHNKIYLIGIEYTLTLIIALMNIVLLFNIFCDSNNKLFERFGRSTMPIYISHAAVYIVFSRVVGLIENMYVKPIATVIVILVCLIVFSSDFYTKTFDKSISRIKSIIMVNKATLG